jgi:hypothetical protein
VKLHRSFHAFEEKFPTLSVIIGCLGSLIVAGIVLVILGYIADQLNGASLAFLLLLAFLGGMAAHDKWLNTESERRYYEETWKRHDEIFKRPAN